MRLRKATLSGVRDVGTADGTTLLIYKLAAVLVTSIQHGDTAGDVPIEQFSLSFAKVEVSYFPQSASGKIGPPVTAGYDLKTNTKI